MISPLAFSIPCAFRFSQMWRPSLRIHSTSIARTASLRPIRITIWSRSSGCTYRFRMELTDDFSSSGESYPSIRANAGLISIILPSGAVRYMPRIAFSKMFRYRVSLARSASSLFKRSSWWWRSSSSMAVSSSKDAARSSFFRSSDSCICRCSVMSSMIQTARKNAPDWSFSPLELTLTSTSPPSFFSIPYIWFREDPLVSTRRRYSCAAVRWSA
ncbi:MAG: hypothetical protein LUQ66_04085 [Methanoregula sp.]|nr:hypothetical protein [Methanoregula sp.]